MRQLLIARLKLQFDYEFATKIKLKLNVRSLLIRCLLSVDVVVFGDWSSDYLDLDQGPPSDKVLSGADFCFDAHLSDPCAIGKPRIFRIESRRFGARQ